MRYLLILVFFICVVASAFSRPSSAYVDDPNNDNEEEMEYEGDEEASIDESPRQEDGSRRGKQEPTYEVEPAENNMDFEEKRDVPSPDHQSKEKSNSIPDYKSSNDRDAEEMKQGEPYQPVPLQQRPGRYSEAKEAREQTGVAHHLANVDKRDKIAHRAVYPRRNMKTTASDDKEDDLFEDAVAQQQPAASDNQPSNNDAPIEQDHEDYFKNYYKTLHTPNEKVKLADKNYESYPSHIYRNRRQASDAQSLEKSASSDVQAQNTANENEETVIKRHIKKLSDQELQSLLDSLPVEKRNLLNKIIESDREISKRDITKKAGAVEENNDIDIGILDSNKVHGASVELKNDAGSGVETTENPKQSETSNVSSPSNTDAQELLQDKDVSNNEENKASGNLNDVSNNGESKSQSDPNIQSPKLNTKRETSQIDVDNTCSNLEDIKLDNSNPEMNDENRNYNSAYNYQNEDLSQISDDQMLLDNNVLDHVNKREALLENTDSFKSLEESFPNSNTYKESGEYSEIDMVPLVRVKRRNEGLAINKRSDVSVPDSKIAHIPYIAENDDEDSDEGNEFEDDGFYDRSNLAIDAETNRVSGNAMSSKLEKTAQDDVSRDTKVESNIGSDSDSVLSGVEGVDDNLMYNGGARNRRSVENKPTDLVSKETGLSSLIEMESEPRGDNVNAVNYQENDALGPLHQNYEGALSRMKRIRRAKHPRNTISSSDNNK